MAVCFDECSPSDLNIANKKRFIKLEEDIKLTPIIPRDTEELTYSQKYPSRMMYPEDSGGNYSKRIPESSRGNNPDLKTKNILDYQIYGMLLSNNLPHNLSQVVDNNWMEIHKMTGDEFLLIAFQAPKEWNEHYKDELKKIVGDSFEQYWKDSESDALQGRAYEFLDKFEPKIKPSQLPCLVLFTDPNKDKPEVIIRSIPNWDKQSLYKFMSGMLWTIREISNEQNISDAGRLNVLRDKLTSPTAEVMVYYEYTKDKTVDYLKQHPAQIVKASTSFAAAIATGNVILLSPVVVEFLKAIKGVL
jgi:hypothetical protein